ncbi:adenylate/guanylate cyclase domain-containing protein [Microcoleus sp. S13_B4]
MRCEPVYFHDRPPQFDRLTDLQRWEKIKTMGDAYMVAERRNRHFS